MVANPMDKLHQVPLPLAYLEVQTVFAQRVAELTGARYGDTLWLDTDLPNVPLGFGLGDQMSPVHPVWQEFIRLLRESSTGMEAAYNMYLQRFRDGLIPEFGQNLRWFGCFSYEYESDARAVHVHFANRDDSGYGPLSHHRIQARRSELTALFTHIANAHPDAEVEAAGTLVV
jgi:hypothetical protein